MKTPLRLVLLIALAWAAGYISIQAQEISPPPAREVSVSPAADQPTPLSLDQQRQVLAEYEARQKRLREERQAAFAKAEKASTEEERRKILDDLAAAQLPQLIQLQALAGTMKDAVQEKRTVNRNTAKPTGREQK